MVVPAQNWLTKKVNTPTNQKEQQMDCWQNTYKTGWWLIYPSEKYESQMGVLFPTEWKNVQMFQTTNQKKW